MSLPLSSLVVTLGFGVGSVFLSSPVESFPLNAITNDNQAISLNQNFTEAINNQKITQNKLVKFQQNVTNFSVIAQTSTNPKTAEEFVCRGVEKGKSGDLRGAIADFNQAIVLNPNYASAYYNRGIAYYGLGEYQKAITDYNQAIVLNPNYADAYMGRGLAYDNLGESQKAIADYNQAIVLNPNYADAYNNRGNAYDELGESQKAIADLQKAATLFQQQGNTAMAQTILDVLRKLSQ